MCVFEKCVCVCVCVCACVCMHTCISLSIITILFVHIHENECFLSHYDDCLPYVNYMYYFSGGWISGEAIFACGCVHVMLLFLLSRHHYG